MKRFFRLTGIILLSIILTASASWAVTFSKIVVFGDSLSDNGNMFVRSSGISPSSSHSYKGRYSNGPVWVEYLSTYLEAGLVDLAMGGAETGDSSELPYGLKKQVADFSEIMKAYPAIASDDTLFIVWAGPNDFFDGGMDVAGAVSNINDALGILAGAGAGHIIVPNMPNLGATPLNNGNPALAAGAQALTIAFNTALKAVLDGFKEAHPDITVYDIDIYAVYAMILENAESYGFTDTVNKYVNDDDTVNDDGKVYLFWDDVHPTTRGHRLIASTVMGLIGGEGAPVFSSSGILSIPTVFFEGYGTAFDVKLELYDVKAGHEGLQVPPSEIFSDIFFKLKNITEK